MGRKLTKEEFVEKAVLVHGDRYNYSLAEYSVAPFKIKIICSKHGVFEQTANNHLSGQDCKLCSREQLTVMQTKTQEVFLEECVLLHGNKYDYTQVEYVSTKTKVNLKCNTCKTVFSKSPAAHLGGEGCKVCSSIAKGKRRVSNTEKFTEKASNKLVEKQWNYSKVNYKNNYTKISIGCPVCEMYFLVTPINLWNGSGCPNCMQAGYNSLKTGSLYILRCGDITKIGITNLTAAVRARAISKSFGSEFIVLKEYILDDGSIPRNVETEALRCLRALYEQPNAKFDGYTECFMYVNYQSLLLKIEELITIQKEKNGTY